MLTITKLLNLILNVGKDRRMYLAQSNSVNRKDNELFKTFKTTLYKQKKNKHSFVYNEMKYVNI